MDDDASGEGVGVSEEVEDGVDGPEVALLRFRESGGLWGLVVRGSGCSCSP